MTRGEPVDAVRLQAAQFESPAAKTHQGDRKTDREREKVIYLTEIFY